MSKRTTKLFLFLAALLFPALSWAQQETVTQNGVVYTYDEDHYEITGYEQEQISGTLYISNEIWEETTQQHFPVTKMRDNVFSGLTGITKVWMYNAEDMVVGENAFSGLGTEDAPLALYAYSFSPLLSAAANFENGIATIGGGKFEIFTNFKLVYYQLIDNEFTAVSYDKDAWTNSDIRYINIADELGDKGEKYPVTSIKAGAFDGIEGVVSLNFNIYNFNITEIGENAFRGIGETTPIKLTINANKAKALGGTFNEGVFNLAGGRFSIVKELYSTNYLDLTYTYNEDSEGNGEYILTKADVSPDLSESITDYKLAIYNYFDEEHDADGNLITYVPVTTIKADAISAEAKSKIKDVFVYGTCLKTVEAGAFDGIGTEASPMPLEVGYPVLFGRSVGAEFNDDGVATIGGGYFKITRQEGFIVYQLKGDEYYAVGYDQNSIDEIYNNLPADYDSEFDVDGLLKFAILPSLYEEDAEGSYSFKVKGIKAGAFAGVNHISHVRIEANDQTIGDGAFEGVGSTENPMPLIADFPVQFAKNHNLVFEDGIATIGGGKFQMNAGRGPVIYRLSGDGEEYSYSVCGYNQAEIDNSKDPDGGYELYIASGFTEETEGDEWKDYKVTSIKAGAFGGIQGITSLRIEADELAIGENAFNGIGTEEQPLQLSMNVERVKAFGGTITDGVIDLAGGKFVLAESFAENGFRVTYAYNEDGEGNAEYVINKIEKFTYEWEENPSYQLNIQSTLHEKWDENGNLISFVPVTGIKADAISDEAKELIKSVRVYGGNYYLNPSKLNDAFAGIGEEAPVELFADYLVKLVNAVNATFNEGFATIAGGKFQITRQEGLVKYLLNGEEYIAAGYDKEMLADWISNGANERELTILSGFPETNNEGEETSYNVTTIKANAFAGIEGITAVRIEGNELTTIGEDAFKGIGVDEPLQLGMSVAKVKEFNATISDGVVDLAGGKFVLTKVERRGDFLLNYAYNEGVEGNSEFLLNKVEWKPYGYGEGQNYQLRILATIEGEDGELDENGNRMLYPVTGIMAGAISDETKEYVKEVFVENENGCFLNPDKLNSAFAGLGT
ncbi:MAG: leucine-rich repeat protein, partial [Prevotella sp.]|nr:leucine-rich repeat protein [Prevotella sp.]